MPLITIPGSQCCTCANYTFYCLVCRSILSAPTIKQIHLLHGSVLSRMPAHSPWGLQSAGQPGSQPWSCLPLCPPGSVLSSPQCLSHCTHHSAPRLSEDHILVHSFVSPPSFSITSVFNWTGLCPPFSVAVTSTKTPAADTTLLPGS